MVLCCQFVPELPFQTDTPLSCWHACAHTHAQGGLKAQIVVAPVSSTVNAQAKHILSFSTMYSSSVFFFYPDDPKHTLRSLEMYTGCF